MYAAIARLRGTFRSTDTDRGATAVEYGLMVALIAAAIAGIVYILGQSLNTKFNNVNTCINNAQNCGSNGLVG
jgi:pilus assembly protein Flp/PilA